MNNDMNNQNNMNQPVQPTPVAQPEVPVQPQPQVQPQGQVQQPQVPVQPTPVVQPQASVYPPQPPKKKSNAGLIVGIVVLVIVAILVFVGIRACSFVKHTFDEAKEKTEEIRKELQEDSNLPSKEESNTTSNTVSNKTSNSNTQINSNTNGFVMAIEDVFTISGRGTVVTGRIERGSIMLNDEVEIIGIKEGRIHTVVTGIEMFSKALDKATAGDNVGLLLRGVERSDVERGMVVISPKSMNTYTKFEAQIKTLTKEEGGRHTPFFNNYRPQVYFRTTDVTGTITLPEGIDMVMPGDTVNVTIELVKPMAMEEGTVFAIREGGRTIGNGKVTKLK